MGGKKKWDYGGKTLRVGRGPAEFAIPPNKKKGQSKVRWKKNPPIHVSYIKATKAKE